MSYYFVLMLIYVFFAIIETNGDFSPKDKKRLCFILLFPLWAMASFRAENIGNDTVTYIRAFSAIGKCENLQEAILQSRMESGYAALSYLFAKCGATYLFFQTVISTFIYWSLWRFIAKYSMNIGLSCFVFLSMQMFAGPMNTVRMWLGIAVILLSIPFLINKRLIPFLIIVGIASMFHTTALIFILLYPVFHIAFIRQHKGLIVLAAIVIAILGVSFFEWLTAIMGKYDGYLDSHYFMDFNKTAIYLTLSMDVCFGLLFYLTRERKHGPKKNIVFPKATEYDSTEIFSIIMIIIIAFDIVGLTNTIMSRVSSYFTVFYLLMIPFAVKKIPFAGNRLIISNMIMLMLTVQWIVVMVYRPEWYGVVPFTWFFQ